MKFLIAGKIRAICHSEERGHYLWLDSSGWHDCSPEEDKNIRRGNPYPVYSDKWHSWKEQYEGWLPYHVGNGPTGIPCPSSGRVRKLDDNNYKCPVCGKVFPTYTSETGIVPMEGE